MQEMTMIERVARALDPSIWQAADDGMINPTGKQMSLDAARRAIEAMREPTELMCSHGESAASVGIGKCYDDEAIVRVFRDMIDAALDETPCHTLK